MSNAPPGDDSSTVLDLGRAVLPHRDPTFDAVVRRLEQGEPAVDWRITGPRLVRPSAAPEVAPGSVSLNLMPEVARAVLLYLNHIAEPQPSRSGRSNTYRLKRRDK